MANVTWEYRVLPVTSEIAGEGGETLEQRLDELGVEGWELVVVDSSSEATLYVFKRRLAAASSDEGVEEYGDEEYDGEEYDDDEYDEDGTIRINPPAGRM